MSFDGRITLFRQGVGLAASFAAFFLISVHTAAGSAVADPAEMAGVRSSELARRPEVASALRMLEAWIEHEMEFRAIPGVSIGIVYDQELIWARGFGYADVEKKIPATPETVYRIASISKLFTSTAIMQLRDAGKLGLDDPVAKHLAWFKIKPSDPANEPITIRNLLTHTGGMPREAPYPYWSDFDFPTREKLIEGLARQQTAFPPYTKWKYSNLGVAIAGQIVEVVSGEPYAQYVEKHILEPLGMTGSSVGVSEGTGPRLATGYGRRQADGSRAVQRVADLRAFNPAGGVCSTVEDLARFASLQLRAYEGGGPPILKGSTLREMHRVQWLSPDWTCGWGIGFRVTHTSERDLINHSGWVLGHLTYFAVSPKEKVGVIVLTNADDVAPRVGLHSVAMTRAFQWVAPAIVKAAAVPTEPKTADPQWQMYVGKYRSPWEDTQILVLNGELVALSMTSADPSAGRVRLIRTGKHTFRTESDGAFVEDGDIVVFEVGDDGQVKRLRWNDDYSERVR
jgi:D-alanyl-D-alanine carboxypeptidase